MPTPARKKPPAHRPTRMPTKQPSHLRPILDHRPPDPRNIHSFPTRRSSDLGHHHRLISTATHHFFVVRVTRVGSDPVVGASRHRRRTRRRRVIPITRHRHRTIHRHRLTFTTLVRKKDRKSVV